MSSEIATEMSSRSAVPRPTTTIVLTPTRQRAVLGWVAACLVYFTAVFDRTSLGVAGLVAAHRFGISPGQLGVFVLLQLGVYAAMQVPTGVLVDRFGPRRMLVVAAVTMCVAQAGFAFAPSYPAALLARGLLGCGDAMTFVSVLRFAAVNFSPRRYPIIVAATSMFGYAGNVVATVPLAVLLRDAGWEPTFAGSALASAVAIGAVLLLMPKPASTGTARRAQGGEHDSAIASNVRVAWASAGTKLGFWVHFSCMASVTVFGLLWGLPYLVSQGISSSVGSSLLLLSVAVSIVASVSIGVVIAAHPSWRVPLALGVCATTMAGWAILLTAGGDRPSLILVAVVVCVMSFGGPASSIGFALARDYNRPTVVGTASGIVNVGGFAATIIAAAAVGTVLELAGNSGAGSFRLAFATALVVQLLGTIQIARWWRRTRAVSLQRQDRGDVVPVLIVRRPWDLNVISDKSRWLANSRGGRFGPDLAQ
jgi:MFS family permease